MNLGKLLAAGKSVINGRVAIAYRANRNVYLPKFGPARNPFQDPADAEAVPSAPALPAVPMVKAAPVAAKTQKIPPWPPAPARASVWAGRLNPVSLWRGAPPVEETRPPVQSELSLDAVKVLHNDLSDADVQVVPVKSRTVDPASIPELPPPTRPWEYLAERMFHATVD